MNKENLLQYYLNLREPEAYQWNLSPRSLYIEYITRDYFERKFTLFDGIKVCNVGIGVGEWDDYLGYLLHGNGSLTSVDINPDICSIFSYRQKIEGHPNPSQVICENIIETTLEENQFDIVTIIGSTLEESKQYENVLKSCFNLLKDNGYLMVMDFEKNKSFEDFKKVISQSDHLIIDKEAYETYESLSFYICKVRK